MFKAWTDPDHLIEWFAPDGCSIRFERLDLREGGGFHSCITTPDGYECWAKGVYLDITPPERIVMIMAITDQEGNLVEPIQMGMDPEWPRETIVTVTLEDLGSQTRMTLHQTVSEALAKRTGAHPSWLQMFDRLAASLRHK